MKTAADPRHLKRIKKFKTLFAQSFTDQKITHQEEIDKIITTSAPEWPISQINKTDLAILRLALYELIYKKNTPAKVIIDEAVEIAKRYGSESSGGFVNGALAKALSITRPKENE